MNRLLTVMFAALLVGACASTPKAPLTPVQKVAQEKAPWDEMPSAEAADYASCDKATTLMHEAISWPLEDADNLPDRANINGRYLTLRNSPDGVQRAVLSYRIVAGKKIFEMGMVGNKKGFEAGTEKGSLIADWKVVRAVKSQTDLGIMSPFDLAEGEFFCFVD